MPPRFFKFRQQLVCHPLADVEGEILRQLDQLGLRPPRGPVAITAGSRGIANIARIVRAAGLWLREHGAEPFLVPCMGSHGGGTAAGQRAMLVGLGLSEEATGLPIRSGTETVPCGHRESPAWIDRFCWEAGAVLVINRIKLHTSFSGSLQSGLAKMMAVGMGKRPAAEAFHRVPGREKSAWLKATASRILATGKIFAGLAILEDGEENTAEIHALRPEEILDREPSLLKRAGSYFPRLPLQELHVLLVAEIGKNFSGTGMDTNVIGRYGLAGEPDPPSPRIRIIAALGLSTASQGNALGVGLADFITRRLREAIDERKTMVNVLTTGEMRRMAIPCTLENDQELVRTIAGRFGTQRWMAIANTLHLRTLYASEDLAGEIAAHPGCEIQGPPESLPFEKGRLRLEF